MASVCWQLSASVIQTRAKSATSLVVQPPRLKAPAATSPAKLSCWPSVTYLRHFFYSGTVERMHAPYATWATFTAISVPAHMFLTSRFICSVQRRTSGERTGQTTTRTWCHYCCMARRGTIGPVEQNLWLYDIYAASQVVISSTASSASSRQLGSYVATVWRAQLTYFLSLNLRVLSWVTNIHIYIYTCIRMSVYTRLGAGNRFGDGVIWTEVPKVFV